MPFDSSSFIVIRCGQRGDRRLPSGRLSMAVAASVIAGSLTGCAMSERAYHKLAAGVSARNERRYLRAEAQLEAKGYVFADRDLLYATLVEDAARRCLESAHHVAPLDPAERMRVLVAPASQAYRPPPVPTEFSVGALDACSFFRARTDQLDARKADGSALRMIRIGDDLRLARDRRGEFALVAVSNRIVSRRVALVKRTCDRMPHPHSQLDPLEMHVSPRVLLASAPPPRVEMVIEWEELDVKCTENSY